MLRNFITALAFVFAASIAVANEAPKPLQVGSPSPVFEGKDDKGKLFKSTDHVGKRPIVVFFYPAAMTGG